MSAKFNNGTSAAGVVAYQDHVDPNQFYYLPRTVYAVLGENLSEFLVTYWGISDSFYDQVDGKYQSISGAILGGKAKIDINEFLNYKVVKVFSFRYTNYFILKIKYLSLLILYNSIIIQYISTQFSSITIYKEILLLSLEAL